MSRKFFDYNNISISRKRPFKNSISACGCLFYKNQGSLQLLLIEYENPEKPYLDDFGGKIEMNDASVLDAMVREVAEETNFLLPPDTLYPMLTDAKSHYNRNCKYFGKLIEVDDTFFPDTSVFGKKEGKHVRSVGWYNYVDVKHRLAPRIQDAFSEF